MLVKIVSVADRQNGRICKFPANLEKLFWPRARLGHDQSLHSWLVCLFDCLILMTSSLQERQHEGLPGGDQVQDVGGVRSHPWEVRGPADQVRERVPERVSLGQCRHVLHLHEAHGKNISIEKSKNIFKKRFEHISFLFCPFFCLILIECKNQG